MTAKPGRDQLLDQTLKHGLSSAAAWGQESECLDAETLAAWADGGLERHQTALTEAHLSNCGHCQELLAAVTRALPPAAGRSQIGALADWRWWLVPMTAAAAAGLWMIVPQRDYLASPAPAAEIARAVPPAPPSAAAPISERPTPPAPVPAEPIATSQAVAAPAPVTPAPVTPAPVAAAPVAAAPVAPAREVPRPAAQAAPDRSQGEEVRKSTAPPAGSVMTDRTATAKTPAPAPAPPPAPSLAEAVTSRPAPPPAVAAPEAGFSQVVSPDSRFRWRYSAVGLDRSTDGGTTWEQVSEAIGRFVTAGTAPSATVCWLVARGGGVFVTDDGRNFFRARFPEIINLVGVTATSRAAATVTTDDGRTFVTADGGVTWRQQ